MITFDGEFTPKDLDQTLQAMGPDVYFIQIGAMDGVSYDPIHKHVKKQKWKGLLFEPIPDMFVKLQNNYRDCSGLTFVNAAIADYEGAIEMMCISEAGMQKAQLTQAALGLSSFLPDRGHLGHNPHYTGAVKE
ncbi:MAG: FkbM family methyltransferase, partial [Alphaproteobacteria bacterium]